MAILILILISIAFIGLTVFFIYSYKKLNCTEAIIKKNAREQNQRITMLIDAYHKSMNK